MNLKYLRMRAGKEMKFRNQTLGRLKFQCEVCLERNCTRQVCTARGRIGRTTKPVAWAWICPNCEKALGETPITQVAAV